MAITGAPRAIHRERNSRSAAPSLSLCYAIFNARLPTGDYDLARRVPSVAFAPIPVAAAFETKRLDPGDSMFSTEVNEDMSANSNAISAHVNIVPIEVVYTVDGTSEPAVGVRVSTIASANIEHPCKGNRADRKSIWNIGICRSNVVIVAKVSSRNDRVQPSRRRKEVNRRVVGCWMLEPDIHFAEGVLAIRSASLMVHIVSPSDKGSKETASKGTPLI